MKKTFKDKIKYFEYKKRFVLFILIILLLLILAVFLLKKTYAKYVTDANVDVEIENAVYIFETETMSFNIDLDDIIPSSTPYVYTFSVSNYDDTKTSDVDIDYTISMTTTTNMPLTYQLYRNQNYDAVGATNIISSYKILTDVDLTWYNQMLIGSNYRFNYGVEKKDVYYLVINFPIAYSINTNYADAVDNIEITINSYQVID